ncbi:MAG: hypothetical protein A2X05_17925 [Bacteroidetes bacterium GWE2_41_25]|nr:MAG: hypothetical protein A2X03_06195 [Bacteroidetes bacterium GWA2_40_15]OFX99125.1 MAG: hypothetical protein A2X05_17925 [Bacteroidetes bacterium GWE2_41_25]OFY57962.1 MAG: hypothetical protein A2X04_06305 [Bacteroidetes bacterium GWF2_41_9]HCU20629.1 hypothetical protein [Bacteroidales bacterium]
MKTLKKLLLVLAIILNIFMGVYAQSVSGTWTFSNGNFPITMLLLDSGTGELQGMPIRYKAENGMLTIDDGVQPVIYDYKLGQNTLTLSGGNLQVAVTFSKPGVNISSNVSNAPNTQNNTQINQPVAATNQQTGNMSNMAGNNDASPGSGSELSGIWEGQQGKIIFYPDGLLLYNGTSYNYTSYGNSLTITGTDGSVTFNCNLKGIQLTLSQNANSAVYSKTGDIRPDRVDPQLVGKWCMITSSYNSYSGGGSSREECITLNANGTYEYFYSGSVSAYTVDKSAYGGTGSQDNDRGIWKTDGETILSVSQTTGKTSRYSLLKQNEQNGDPAIVIGGRKFVTAYNRPRW